MTAEGPMTSRLAGLVPEEYAPRSTGQKGKRKRLDP